MAIKITGTTVINDSRGLENITDIEQIVKAPEILSPTDNETEVDFRDGELTIEGGPYDALFSNNRDYREFQIDLATGDFSSPVVSQQVNSDSLTLTTDLATLTEHKVRIRDVDLDGTVSPFSAVVNFTTDIILTNIGEASSGGFYMGTIAAAGTCYYLIVAPNATGCVDGCVWKTSETSTSGTCSETDGYANTYPALENTDHPAGNWTATRTIGGFSDWYLASEEENDEIYNNGAGDGFGDPLPPGEDYEDQRYWTSTKADIGSAYTYDYGGGFRAERPHDFEANVRAVRRVPV